MLELTDLAPIPLREPIRGLVWFTGQLALLAPEHARQHALWIAEDRPDPRLLDVGYGTVILRLAPSSLVLADAEGSHTLQVTDFAAAVPDPFCGYEADWLRHLEISHVDVVSLLARHLPAQLHGGHIRPLSLDQFGLRLRVEAIDADHDVRLTFSGQ